MLLTPHVLLGLYLVSTLKPEIGLPAALISHILFDHFYPHWNPHLYTEMKKYGRLSQTTKKVIALDVIISGLCVLFFITRVYPDTYKMAILILGALFSIIPDLIEMPYYFLGNKRPFLLKLVSFEHKTQASVPFWWGITAQILLCLVCVWQLLFH